MIGVVILAIPYYGFSQEPTRKETRFVSDKTIDQVAKKYEILASSVNRFSDKALRRFQKLEARLYKKLAAKDSVTSRRLSRESREVYEQLKNDLNNPSRKNTNNFSDYIPKLDSVQTSLVFLQSPGIPAEKLQQLGAATDQVKQLQTQMQSATAIREFIRQRKQQLKEQFDRSGIGKELSKLNREVFYYQQRLHEYKTMLADPDKLINRLLATIRETPSFADFFSRNSMLAQLFPAPGGYGTAQALQGLQTRSGVQQQLTQQLGAAGNNGGNPQQYLQQQVQQAQAQLNQLKDKVNKLGGGNSDMEIPDFTPNSQHTKTFWNRIEYGFNIQSQKPNGWLPVTSDLALTVGYKLNDKSTIGIGAGYKMGWGNSLNHIRISSQGMSLRSYLDVKLKGSIWISGGYEYNYQQEFQQLDLFKDMNAWQKSGLLGLTKKYTIGKKNGNMQLLWDFLSYSQLPRTTALKFRVGYVL